jgi:hypothetical protein
LITIPAEVNPEEAGIVELPNLFTEDSAVKPDVWVDVATPK